MTLGNTTDPGRIERGVIEVLAGIAPEVAAAGISMTPTELRDAVEAYRAAGAAALERLYGGHGWHQVELRFPDAGTAEQTIVTRLGPVLREAETEGLISTWWFIRKARWRFRLLPGDGVPPEEARARLTQVFAELRDRGEVASWYETLYEPEIHAFGGTDAMAVAHRLFHHDSRCFLDYLHHRTEGTAFAGHRELSMMLCGVLMRAAGQDWYEQGDIWAQVAKNRIDHSCVAPATLSRIQPKVGRLMSVDAGPASMLVCQGALRFASEWIREFHEAGKDIGALAKEGKLSRGVREVLAHHVIFHWNRIGLPASTQAVLASAARETVFGAGP
jgi:thiopeptide-type bacteriocin biosynthesis protein